MPEILTPTPDTIGEARRETTDGLCHYICVECHTKLCDDGSGLGQGVIDCPGSGQCSRPDCRVCDDMVNRVCPWCGK